MIVAKCQYKVFQKKTCNTKFYSIQPKVQLFAKSNSNDDNWFLGGDAYNSEKPQLYNNYTEINKIMNNLEAAEHTNKKNSCSCFCTPVYKYDSNKEFKSDNSYRDDEHSSMSVNNLEDDGFCFAFIIKSTDKFYTLGHGMDDEKIYVPIFEDRIAAMQYMNLLQDFQKYLIAQTRVKKPQFPLQIRKIKYLSFMKSCFVTGLDILLVRKTTYDEIFQKIDASYTFSIDIRRVFEYLFKHDRFPEDFHF